LGATVERKEIAKALCLNDDDIATSNHPPQVASVGLPFLIVELSSRDALERAKVDLAMLEKLRDAGIVPDIHLYIKSGDDFDLRARMYAPLDGVPEDPATGSANCALAAMLAHYDKQTDVELTWRIAQGVEMGRHSVLNARCKKSNGAVTTWIGGNSVLVSEGRITLE
jgi:trans-2,3-dihydro-3-hydroxyanthranilate isomerase